jgi:hypothetical protein
MLALNVVQDIAVVLLPRIIMNVMHFYYTNLS